MNRDAMADNNSVRGSKRHKSTSNKLDDAIDDATNVSTEKTKPTMTTTTTTTMKNPSATTSMAENDKSSNAGDHLEPIGKISTNESPSRVPGSSEDKYCVKIKNGFMKISMMPLVSAPAVTEEKSAEKKDGDDCSSLGNESDEKKPSEENRQDNSRSIQTKLPETVLQFQRQLRKTQAAKRASTPLLRSQLQIVYDDEQIVVVNKPSGVLTVPGINSNPSMLSLLYEVYKQKLDPEMKPEHMIVHRLDMDTSGIVMYAKTKKTLLSLQALFRNRDGVSKYYEAVVCGHIHPEVERGRIDLPLQRDHRFPPFMRVATPRSEREAQEVVRDLKKAGWKKIVKKKAKPSETLFEVISREYRFSDGDASVDERRCQGEGTDHRGKGYPVTRLKLTPITGRTHQLRVHCASIGHPILGDPTYGIYGEASPNGGFEDYLMDELVPKRADIDLQLALDQYVKEKGQVMCLHARELRLKHPETGEAMAFEQPPDF